MHARERAGVRVAVLDVDHEQIGIVLDGQDQGLLRRAHLGERLHRDSRQHLLDSVKQERLLADQDGRPFVGVPRHKLPRFEVCEHKITSFRGGLPRLGLN